MAFFNRQRGIPSTGHPGDDHLLSVLAASSDLASARHWMHFLYAQHEAGAREAAQMIEAAGWHLQQVAVAADGGRWIVIAENDDAVTSPEAVRAARSFFESVAARTPGGEYDGWEAAL